MGEKGGGRREEGEGEEKILQTVKMSMFCGCNASEEIPSASILMSIYVCCKERGREVA